MKRISSEVITGALRQVWYKEKSIPFGVFDLVTTLIDRQLEFCEKEADEKVRAIVQELFEHGFYGHWWKFSPYNTMEYQKRFRRCMNEYHRRESIEIWR